MGEWMNQYAKSLPWAIWPIVKQNWHQQAIWMSTLEGKGLGLCVPCMGASGVGFKAKWSTIYKKKFLPMGILALGFEKAWVAGCMLHPGALCEWGGSQPYGLHMAVNGHSGSSLWKGMVYATSKCFVWVRFHSHMASIRSKTICAHAIWLSALKRHGPTMVWHACKTRLVN